MRLILSLTTALLLGLFTTASTASANVIFNLSNVNLALGGTPEGALTGSFTTNNALTSVLSYSLTASAAPNFPGLTYNSTNSSITASVLPTFFQVDLTSSAGELRLLFSGLTAAGGTLTTSSYEFEPTGGSRLVTSGSVVAAASGVPEPATAALLAAALIPLALLGRRRVTAQ